MADMTNQISNWAGGGASVTLGAIQTLYGMQQQKKNKRPTYEIPSEIKANMTQAEQMALQGLPEEQKQQYINNLQRSQAFSMSQASSRKAGLAGLAAVNQQGIDAYGNLLSADAQARQANQQLAMQQRNVMADYKDQAFQLNKLNPYYEKTAQNQAMIGAGMQNMSQGFQSSNSGGDWSSSNRQQQQSQQPQFNRQQAYIDTNRNRDFNYNPNGGSGQGGSMYMDGQFGQGLNSDWG